MPSTTQSPGRLRRLARAAVVVLVGVGVALSSTDSAIGWLIPITLVGGSLVAVLLLAMQSRRRPTIFSPDAFARGDSSTDIISVSHIRVAGVGGLGLVLAALTVGLQYPLATAVLITGAVGGLIGGVAVILYRRRSGPVSSSSAGPSARSVFLLDAAEKPTEDTGSPETSEQTRLPGAPEEIGFPKKPGFLAAV